MSTKHILVALDRSQAAEMVFSMALDLARKDHRELVIFHGLNLPSPSDRDSFLGLEAIGHLALGDNLFHLSHQSLGQDLQLLRSWLGLYEQQAQNQGLKTHVECRVGEPGRWICDLAVNYGTELVVMGRRGHSGLSELLMGSISNYVVHHAPCSVLVVQGKPLVTP